MKTARLLYVLRFCDDLIAYVDSANTITEKLRAAGICVMGEPEIIKAGDTSSTFNTTESFLIIAIGGDGTFATACRDFGGKNSMIVGVQAGTLNFLNAYTPESVDTIASDEVKVSERILGKIVGGMHFTNDAVITNINPLNMSEYVVHDAQDRFIMRFKGDGLIVSTPMGSTAYNMSAGGPILHPTMDAFVITPKFPTLLSGRPMVIPMSMGLKISTNQENYLVADGLLCDTIHTVELAKGKTVEVLLPTHYSFFEQVRTKLGWYK